MAARNLEPRTAASPPRVPPPRPAPRWLRCPPCRRKWWWTSLSGIFRIRLCWRNRRMEMRYRRLRRRLRKQWRDHRYRTDSFYPNPLDVICLVENPEFDSEENQRKKCFQAHSRWRYLTIRNKPPFFLSVVIIIYQGCWKKIYRELNIWFEHLTVWIGMSPYLRISFICSPKSRSCICCVLFMVASVLVLYDIS